MIHQKLSAVSGKLLPSSFELKDLKLRYETIENPDSSSEVQSACPTDKSMYYTHCTLVKSFPVSASTTMIHENINLPQKSLNHVMLFKCLSDSG